MTLLHALVDDAGLFPPASLPMSQAVARHLADERAGSPMLTHRFLCPAGRVAELAAAAGQAPIRLGLILGPGLAGLDTALAEVTASPALRLELVEAPLGPGDAASLAGSALAALAGLAVPAFLEPAAGPDALAAIAVIAGWRSRAGAGPVRGAKVRCGGQAAAAFPSPSSLAAFLLACATAGVPLKATAGLHHAVRHTDPETGFTHHGFLNLLVATAHAVQGASAGTVADALACQDGGWLAAQVTAMPASLARRAREVLVSYGSCDTAEPVAEAQALGLLQAEAPG